MNYREAHEKALRRAEKERLRGNVVTAKHFEKRAKHLEKLIRESAK